MATSRAQASPSSGTFSGVWRCHWLWRLGGRAPGAERVEAGQGHPGRALRGRRSRRTEVLAADVYDPGQSRTWNERESQVGGEEVR